ncbi:coiled-coil domain-containing protein 157-like isoform X3 [Penaeus monodon]|uniref:coiled-coil domain-containing protein 157-like isoform X3 n=1 Tax=Penaeus monodon TaxID=6687 RepID=UPI0018A6FB2F|nr:coiled-coil domain-containing protein 157-like isoform X3 [Penaeus monodon]
MFGLLLFSFCVAGWAASTPTGDATSETPYAHERCPCVVLRQEDFAHLLADFRNISEGLHEVTPGMQRLSEVLSPLLQEDSIFGRDAFVRELLVNIKEQESQMQDLRREWTRTAAATRHLEDDDLTLQIDLSLQEIQQREDAIEQVKLSIQDTNEENQQHLAKASATAVETLSRRGEMQALKGQVTQLKALYAQKQATKTQLEQQITELESDKSEIQQEIAQLEKKAKILKNVIVVPNDEKTSLQKSIAWLKEAIKKRQTENTQFQIAIAQLNGTISQLVTENELQSNKRETIKAELKGLQVSLNFPEEQERSAARNFCGDRKRTSERLYLANIIWHISDAYLLYSLYVKLQFF